MTALSGLREALAAQKHGALSLLHVAPEHHRAIIMGQFVEVHVDTRQAYMDPTPLAKAIVLSVNAAPGMLALADAVWERRCHERNYHPKRESEAKCIGCGALRLRIEEALAALEQPK